MPGATRKRKRVRAPDPLLHAVADASRVLIESNDVVCAIPRALGIIGEVAGASRAQLAWEDAENARHRVAYAWTGPGAGPQLQDDSSLIPNDFLGPKLHLLHVGQSVLFEDSSEFPETARAFIADLGIAATAAVPIMVGGAYAGMLCFDFDRPVELDPKLAVLQASAHAIAAAVQRQKDLQVWADERQKAADVRASELTAANAALVNREKVLASVAEVSRLLLCPEKVSDVLSQCMQVLGEAGDLDRVNLLRSAVDERTGALYHICEYEWVRAGFVAQMSNPEFLISYDSDFPALAEPVRAGRSFWYQVDAMENPLREFLQSVGIKTTAGVPVFVDAAYYGCLSFNTCRAARPWAQHDLDLLQAAAGAIGAALDRELLVERVTEQRERASLERVAELARTNEALRRGVGRVSQTRDVRLLLQGSVQEACRIAQACAGAVLATNAGARSTVLAATTPSFQPSSDWVLLEPRLIAGDLVEQLAASGGLCYVPLLLGGELQGAMVLQRDSARPVDVTTRETLRALAHQSALLMRLDALVDAEKTAAIAQAREQETRKRA
ncbi:MAG TPA: GAF domain-containing protein, partial [Bryobacteraceae bacterium]|nr:GAF domain-containing protein [Bryobacteraceae bacterium]